MNKWMLSRYKVRFKGRTIDVYSAFYDILTCLVQIHLDALFLFGSIVLALQVMWKKLFPTSQQKVTNRDILPSEDHGSRTFTARELRQYDGVQDRRIYIAVNGKVFDTTNTKDIQFLDGPFNCLAGRDASRALATFSLNEQLNNLSENIDDLSDLNPLQMDSLFHWEMQYSERYPCVGRLVRRHQPRALQQACIKTICATIGELKGPLRKKVVDELPLPRLLRNKIVYSG
ncbi:hypothetical protein ACROYT_G037494 [Oculina patagonica]